MTSNEHGCARCGAPTRRAPIDDTNEVVIVDPESVLAAIKIPGLVGFTTDHVYIVHRCWPGKFR